MPEVRMRDDRIFGSGVAFPPVLASEGRLEFSSGPANVRESIRVILGTEPGERLMLANFGAGLRRFLFEPNTVATRRLIQDQIVDALARWETRIRLESVMVEADPADARSAIAVIQYSLIATQQREQVAVRVQTGS
jgi:phage baseplate assembly protein W